MQFNLNSNFLAKAATIAALSVGITFAALANQQASAQTFTGGAINSTSLSGYDSQVFNSKQITHVGNNGNIYELYITKGGSWQYADLSQLVGGAPQAIGGISGYDSQVFNSKQVAYVGKNGNIYELYITKGGSWQYADLSQLVGGAPQAIGGISGYDSQVFNSKQVAYVGKNGSIYELYITKGGNWQYADLSQLAGGAPQAIGGISGYDSQVFNSKQVAYVGKNGNIHELYITKNGNWKFANLSQITGGAPQAIGGISGYDSKVFNSKQVAYVGNNGNIYELYITKGGNWKYANLSQIAGGAPAAVGRIIGYDSQVFNSKQVAYVGKNGNIYELYVTKDGNWKYANLSQIAGGAPRAVSVISGYDSQVFNSKQVAYVGTDGNIYELYITKGGNWKYANLSQITSKSLRN